MSVSLIAKKAGVSIATVSRVLNNSRAVNPRMAEAVRRAMEELQLPAKKVRRRSRSRARDEHSTIAIVSLGQGYRGWFEIPVLAGVVAELTRAAQEHQMGVLITEMLDPNELGPVLRRRDIDGALVFVRSGLTTKDVAVLRQQLPVVRVMGGQLSPVEIDHIGVDNNAIGYLAGQYLLDQGLRDVALLTTQPGWDISKLRGQGFLDAVQTAGVMPAMYVQGQEAIPLGFYGGSPIVEDGLEALVKRYVADLPQQRPVGLFVTRDEETVHVYRLLQEAGVQPGKDVIVVSCDNESVRLSSLQPRPASIDLCPAQIAAHAVRRLASRIKHRDEPAVRLLVTPKLVPGET